jgi:hypothetical protein
MLNDEAAIRQRAYEIWQAEGGLHGKEVSHWLRAQQEIRGITPATPRPSRRPAAKQRGRSTKS